MRTELFKIILWFGVLVVCGC